MQVAKAPHPVAQKKPLTLSNEATIRPAEMAIWSLLGLIDQ
jgi:hypothetical protein